MPHHGLPTHSIRASQRLLARSVVKDYAIPMCGSISHPCEDETENSTKNITMEW